MNVLFACSEVHPLIKTGGLADVAGYLPRALRHCGVSIRVVVPGYPEILDKVGDSKTVGSYQIDGFKFEILESKLPGTQVKFWMVRCAKLFEREGGPYQDSAGQDWPDNAIRFGLFAKMVVGLVLGWVDLKWSVDLVHCNDWQTGLIPALLRLYHNAPPSLFTIHNLAYQGLFPYQDFSQLKLPPHLWSHHALEFYEQLSFLKGGLVFADRINTVSPRYAREIQTKKFGCGLEGLLKHREKDLSGILNGTDTQQWNPGTDREIAHVYNKRTLGKKKENKLALQKLFELPIDENIPLFSVVTRITQQKGIDLILDAMPLLKDIPVQIALLGSGDKELETQLLSYAKKHSRQFALKLAYNESWAHLAIAGADAFLMPSRFEPCGLTQLYSLRYGTIPVVHAVGGLADTVVNATKANLAARVATGVHFTHDSANALASAIKQTVKLYDDHTQWKQMQLTAMQQDFSWKAAAEKYLELYRQLITDKAKATSTGNTLR